MRQLRNLAATAILIGLSSACTPAAEQREAPAADATSASAATAAEPASAGPPDPQSGPQAPFAAIATDETIRFTGTEPFWGGTVRDGELLYSTPENQAGDTIAVRRFAGNNGLGFSGIWNGAPFDMTITAGSCSDGMSDRTYPFTVTLKLGEEQRNGCAWTDRTPFSGSEHP